MTEKEKSRERLVDLLEQYFELLVAAELVKARAKNEPK